MKCIINKSIKVNGIVYNIGKDIQQRMLHVMITNDKLGKTISINDGERQFVIPVDNLVQYLM